MHSLATRAGMRTLKLNVDSTANPDGDFDLDPARLAVFERMIDRLSREGHRSRLRRRQGSREDAARPAHSVAPAASSVSSTPFGCSAAAPADTSMEGSSEFRTLAGRWAISLLRSALDPPPSSAVSPASQTTNLHDLMPVVTAVLAAADNPAREFPPRTQNLREGQGPNSYVGASGQLAGGGGTAGSSEHVLGVKTGGILNDLEPARGNGRARAGSDGMGGRERPGGALTMCLNELYGRCSGMSGGAHVVGLPEGCAEEALRAISDHAVEGRVEGERPPGADTMADQRRGLYATSGTPRLGPEPALVALVTTETRADLEARGRVRSPMTREGERSPADGRAGRIGPPAPGSLARRLDELPRARMASKGARRDSGQSSNGSSIRVGTNLQSCSRRTIAASPSSNSRKQCAASAGWPRHTDQRRGFYATSGTPRLGPEPALVALVTTETRADLEARGRVRSPMTREGERSPADGPGKPRSTTRRAPPSANGGVSVLWAFSRDVTVPRVERGEARLGAKLERIVDSSGD
ncbi:hypothetical protein THAOC_12900 [Thalassiosira oceanica]|uniref:Uncharacterized protein n=1 Tax=Thalassiosira oceanica TaxID=159749 RepID=K0SML7_THAOC|nr:hypothetical protein THAOC_12900 [Thalassiosira oceanica]|eukprot:EJK66194.1 hypothetical protein THAOC_12900 [Thalassiosira oceanica]